MRPLLLLGAGALVLLGVGACDQDYAASNADRHSFMGAIHAAPLPSVTPAETLPPPAMPPAAAVPATAPAASSAAPAPSAKPAPAAPGKH